MRDFLTRFQPLREGEGAGSGGGQGGGGQGGGGEGGGQGGGAGAASPYVPDGLPENLRGKTDKDTIDGLFKAFDGYRQRDASRDVPADEKGYFDIAGAKNFKPEKSFEPYFKEMASDPAFAGAAKFAKAAGIDRGQFLGLIQAALGGLSEGGLLTPIKDAAAERAALLPDSAKNLPEAEQQKAIEARTKDNLAFVDLMVANKGLDKEAADFAKFMLDGTAAGHKFLEWIKGTVGGGAGPGAHGGAGGADTADKLRAEMAALSQSDPDYNKKYAALEERYKAVYGN